MGAGPPPVKEHPPLRMFFWYQSFLEQTLFWGNTTFLGDLSFLAGLYSLRLFSKCFFLLSWNLLRCLRSALSTFFLALGSSSSSDGPAVWGSSRALTCVYAMVCGLTNTISSVFVCHATGPYWAASFSHWKASAKTTCRTLRARHVITLFTPSRTETDSVPGTCSNPLFFGNMRNQS